MKLHPLRTRRLTGAVLSAAAALAAVGLSAAPAQAANLAAPGLTVTLLPGNAATVQVCWTETADPVDVALGIAYVERVQVWGQDAGPDQFLDVVGAPRTRVFPDLVPRSLCRTKNYANRSVLNEDFLGRDELYARIVLDPVPVGLASVVLDTGVLSVPV